MIRLKGASGTDYYGMNEELGQIEPAGLLQVECCQKTQFNTNPLLDKTNGHLGGCGLVTKSSQLLQTLALSPSDFLLSINSPDRILKLGLSFPSPGSFWPRGSNPCLPGVGKIGFLHHCHQEALDP